MHFLVYWKRWLHRLALGGLTALALLGYQRIATAAAPEPAKSKAPGAASGELTIYTAWDERDINALIAGFNKVYPSVKVNGVRSEGGRGALLERLLTEIDAGKPMADIYSTGIPDMSAMLQRGELLSYHSPSESNIDPRFVFKDGLLHPTANLVFMTVYNRTVIQEREAPRTWEDLLNPKWKGKIAIDQEPNDIVAGAIKDGAPLAAAPMPAYFSSPNVDAILKRAPHVENAKVWIDWLQSPSGQEVVAKRNRGPVGKTEGTPDPTAALIRGREQVVMIPAKLPMGYNDIARLARDIFLNTKP